MKKIQCKVFTTLFLISISILSCHEALSPPLCVRDVQNIWEKQIEKVINTPHELLVRSNIKLLSYEVLDIVDSPSVQARYASILKTEKPMLPFISPSEENKIQTISKGEVMRTKSMYQNYSFQVADRAIDSLLTEGMRIVRLRWDNNGEMCETLCVVSDADGIVYDHFISNIIIVGPEKITRKAVAEVSALTKYDERPKFTGTTYWYLDRYVSSIYAIEGSSIRITHSVYFIDDVFQSQQCYPYEYPLKGQAKAGCRSVSNGTIAYYYAFAPYDIPIYIYTDWLGGYEVSFHYISGSTASGTGYNTITAQSFGDFDSQDL